MNTDNYEFTKSCLPQGVDLETPYQSKQWGFISDINSGSYSNNGLSLVQFDLSSIYNSSNLIDPSSMFLTIPITYVTTNVMTTGALVAPSAGGWASTGLKSGFFQLIHGADFTLNGKTINQFQPNLNAYVGFKMLSQMSQDDLATLGPTIGMGDKIDNWESAVYNGSGTSSGTTNAFPNTTVSGGVGGNGMVNNSAFSLTTANGGDPAVIGNQFTGSYNNGLFSRVKRIMDTTATSNNLFGGSGSTGTTVITNVTNMVKEFKPYYTVNNTYYQTWYDVAVIRLADIFDSVKHLPLMKKMDALTRFYINTGTVVSNVTGTALTGASTGVMMTSGAGITFTNTCPLIQCVSKALATNLTNCAGSIVSGLFISTPTATSLSASGLTGINLASGTQSHFMNACRIYYAQVQLKPERLIPYITENRAKTVVYTDFLTNTFNNISAGSTSSFLVQSGVSNIRGVLVLPILSGSTNGSASTATPAVIPFNQLLSPFDTCPMTTAPISLINLQCSIGGMNILQNVMQYSFENFIEQVTQYEKINAGDLGLSCGLINQAYWENIYRAYYIDCSRASIADSMTPRNINLSFTNNSLQTIDVLVFTEYFKEMVVDVETGLVAI